MDPDPMKLNVWVMSAVRGIDPHARLLRAVKDACGVRWGLSVTSADVREQLPDASGFWVGDAQWSLQSIGQVLSTLADQGKIFRVGIFGNPAVQHWCEAPGAHRDRR